MNGLELPKNIIAKSLKSPSGKLLVEYPGWLKLSYEVRIQAAEELTCSRCNKIGQIPRDSRSHSLGPKCEFFWERKWRNSGPIDSPTRSNRWARNN